MTWQLVTVHIATDGGRVHGVPEYGSGVGLSVTFTNVVDEGLVVGDNDHRVVDLTSDVVVETRSAGVDLGDEVADGPRDEVEEVELELVTHVRVLLLVKSRGTDEVPLLVAVEQVVMEVETV